MCLYPIGQTSEEMGSSIPEPSCSDKPEASVSNEFLYIIVRPFRSSFLNAEEAQAIHSRPMWLHEAGLVQINSQ
jgi:hypothetical protein